MDGRQREDVGRAAEVLVDMLAERLAPLVAREVSAVLYREARDLSGRTDGGEAREVMAAREAAEFLGLSIGAFRRLAPRLPRSRISGNRFVYLRSNLLAWLHERTEAPPDWHREREKGAGRGGPTGKRGPQARTRRLV